MARTILGVAFGFVLGLVTMHNPNQQTDPQWWVPIMFAGGWILKGLSK